jgi:hypothetical protein
MLLHLASDVYPFACVALSVTVPSQSNQGNSQIREFGRLWHGGNQIRLLSVSSQNKPGALHIAALRSQSQQLKSRPLYSSREE